MGASRIVEPIGYPTRSHPQGEMGTHAVINLSCWQSRVFIFATKCEELKRALGAAECFKPSDSLMTF